MSAVRVELLHQADIYSEIDEDHNDCTMPRQKLELRINGKRSRGGLTIESETDQDDALEISRRTTYDYTARDPTPIYTQV